MKGNPGNNLILRLEELDWRAQALHPDSEGNDLVGGL